MDTETATVTAHCPFCHADTAQTHVVERDTAGNVVVNLTSCDTCGRDML
jgi:C4-type Zn-finger protein